MDRSRRLELARHIVDQIQDHYGDHVLAIGVYGSLARGTDGPYSDIEMHCTIHPVFSPACAMPRCCIPITSSRR